MEFKMKKALSILLCFLILCLSLSGCSLRHNKTSPDTQTQEEDRSAEQTLQVEIEATPEPEAADLPELEPEATELPELEPVPEELVSEPDQLEPVGDPTPEPTTIPDIPLTEEFEIQLEENQGTGGL